MHECTHFQCLKGYKPFFYMTSNHYIQHMDRHAIAVVILIVLVYQGGEHALIRLLSSLSHF